MSRKPLTQTILILIFFLASCDSVATVSDPTAQLPPIEALETPTVAAIVQTDQSEDEGLEDIYQSAYQKAYEEGFAEGSASCAQGFESDEAYPYEEYRGEDEYQMGYYNGFGEGFFDAYDVCDTITKAQDVENEPQQQDVEQYINEMPDLLAKTDANDRLKMEILETLGVGVYMYPEGEYKNVNWALFGESFRPSGMPSSPLFHFRLQLYTVEQSSAAG